MYEKWNKITEDPKYEIFLEKLKNEEVSHKEDSLNRFGKLSLPLRIWGSIVEIGSKTAVSISYRI